MGNADDTQLQQQDAKRRKKATASAGSQRTGWLFCNLRLTASDKERIKALEYDSDAFEEWRETVIEEGHKYSETYNNDEGVWTCSLSGTDPKGINYKWILTGKGGTPQRARMALHYKAEYLLQGGPFNLESGDDDKLG